MVIFLLMHTIPKSIVTTIIKGRLKSEIRAGMFKSPKRDGIDITAKVLKIFEPIMFPTAMLFKPRRLADILTTISGSEVPRASTVIEINAGLTPNSPDSSTNPSMV